MRPYLGVPLQFANALEQRLLALVTANELEQLRKDEEAELKEPAAGAPRSCSCSVGANERRSGHSADLFAGS
jgi:hypothetical protein